MPRADSPGMHLGIQRGLRTATTAGALTLLAMVGASCGGDHTGTPVPVEVPDAAASGAPATTPAASAAGAAVNAAKAVAGAAATIKPSGDPELDKLDGDLKALESEMTSLDTAIAATQGVSK